MQTVTNVTARLLLWMTIVAAALIGYVVSPINVAAEDFVSEFESPETSWKVFLRLNECGIRVHDRRRGAGRVGGAEVLKLRSSRENSPIRLEHVVPSATVLDELEASLWVKSNHHGFALEMRVTIPEVLNPDTNEPLQFSVMGDKYENTDQWQLLKCRTLTRLVDEQLRVLRANARRRVSINPKVMFVDRVVISGQLPPEDTELILDGLTLTPLVRYQPLEIEVRSDAVRPASQSIVTTSPNNSQPIVPVKFNLHQLSVNDRPIVPRIVNRNGENPSVFASAGMNVVWVPNFEDTSVTDALRQHGLWATAAPPYATGTDGELLDSEDASLLPFQNNTKNILFWMLGPRISAETRPRLPSSTKQIRNADRRFNQRPIAADVIENERPYSRYVDMVGISRHVVGTSTSFIEYLEFLIQRRDLAWPDTFCWTWIQTELSPSLTDMSRKIESSPMMEPEQIRSQVYAALAAGFRGVGYWTSIPLDDPSPAAHERLLAITQLNLELELFESWLSSSGTPQLVPFNVDLVRSDGINQAGRTSRTESTRTVRTGAKGITKHQKVLQAALIQSEHGALLLPMWMDEYGQFVPGSMFARDVSIIVPVASETTSAWEVTTTGPLRCLDRKRAAGGVQITLPRLDQTAAILITSDPSMVEALNQKIADIQERSAQVSVELAKRKLERIFQVDQALQSLGVGRPNASLLLGDAKLQLDRAESALRSQHYAEARLGAGEALQLGRSLQRSHWEYAVRQLPNFTSTPWIASFQSLPEHWKLMNALEKLAPEDSQTNLLPSGEFEDRGTLIASHWTPEQVKLDSVESIAELHPTAKQGSNSLRLSAMPILGELPPQGIAKPFVSIVSPGIGVHTNQVVRITGWAKVPNPITGSIDGAMIYDNLLGKPGAVRLKAAQDWQRFELIRPVPESQDVTITIALHGLGEVLVDDLRVTAVDLEYAVAQPTPSKSAVTPSKYSTFESIRRLNPLNPLPKRR